MRKRHYSILTVLLLFSCSNEFVQLPEEMSCDGGTFVGDVELRTQQEVDDFGANCYTAVDGYLLIGVFGEEVSDITNLSSLSSLKEVGTLLIYNNEKLESLEGIHNIENITGIDVYPKGGLSIVDNIRLKSLPELSGLHNTYLNRLHIYGNDELIDLNGLDGIISTSLLEIRFNDKLASISGLSNIEAVNEVNIRSNKVLRSYLGIENFTSMKSLYLYRNGLYSAGPITISPLNSQNSITQLFMSENGFTSLDWLENAIPNDMEYAIIRHEEFTQIEALSAITTIETLEIFDNDNLLSIEPLSNLQRLDYLEITGNARLISLNGLNSLIECRDKLWIGYYFLGTPENNGNPNLVDFCALDNLFQNGNFGEVVIDNNAYNPTVQDIIDGNCAQ